MTDSAIVLRDKHGGQWGNFARFPTEEWKEDVMDGNTRRDWVVSILQTEELVKL